VAQYYLLGHSYKEIEDETKVSHGSVVNIVKEIENGKLTIPGIPVDQVNDLRQLSFDLKKKGLEPSQALLGISFFERLQELGISPEDLGRWSELVKTFAPADFPAKDFFESAVRLHELEKNEEKPFEELAEQYRRLSSGAASWRHPWQSATSSSWTSSVSSRSAKKAPKRCSPSAPPATSAAP